MVLVTVYSAEAKERKTKDANANVWVIGVDSDQYEEGAVGDANVTLTSMLKNVGTAVQNIAELMQWLVTSQVVLQ